MKVSVIIPIYNGEKYFTECIQSILDQSFTNIEVIVINDGSTDGSLSLIERYAQNDSRIGVINQKNKGVSAARNAGLSKAKGDYIMFVDADDYLVKNNAIELLMNFVDANGNPDIVQFRKVKDARKRILPVDDGSLDDRTLGRMIVNETINTLWDKLYKKSVIRANSCGFPVGIRMAEDLLFNAQYFCAVKTIGFLDEELYFYQEDNQESATKKYMPNKYDDLMYVNQQMIKLFDDGNTIIKNALNYIRIKNIFSCIRDLHNKACLMSEIDKKKLAKKYKSGNEHVIVFGYGVGKMLMSLIYSCMSSNSLFVLSRYIN